MRYAILSILLCVVSGKQMFSAYYGAYFDQSVSNSFSSIYDRNLTVNSVILAFGSPYGSFLTLDFATKYVTQDNLSSTIYKLQSRGTKVGLSIMDTSTSNWNQIDLSLFARSVANKVNEMGLDFIDIDAESSMRQVDYIPCFITLIKELHQALPENVTLYYTCYGTGELDKQILLSVGSYISYVQLMVYSGSYESMNASFSFYAEFVNPAQILVGVSCDVMDLTSLQNVANFTCFNHNSKGGVMLWNLAQDNQGQTGSVSWLWTDTVVKYLDGKSC